MVKFGVGCYNCSTLREDERLANNFQRERGGGEKSEKHPNPNDVGELVAYFGDPSLDDDGFRYFTLPLPCPLSVEVFQPPRRSVHGNSLSRWRRRLLLQSRQARPSPRCASASARRPTTYSCRVRTARTRSCCGARAWSTTPRRRERRRKITASTVTYSRTTPAKRPSSSTTCVPILRCLERKTSSVRSVRTVRLCSSAVTRRRA